jgi:hypothetical protein
MATAKQTSNTGYSGAKDFKKAAYSDLTLPSGLTCAARRVSLEVFIRSGRVPNSLLPLMKGALKGQAKVPAFDEIDAELIASAMELFDLATIEAVQIPEIHWVPARNEDGKRYNEDGSEWERDDELLYIDEVDALDKQFIFQWAIGGVTDVAKFRDGTEKELANLLNGEGVGLPTKRAPRAKR